MKGVILLLGDFTFLSQELDGEFKTIINRIDLVKHFDDFDEAEKFGEDELENYESYLVLQQYRGNIEYNSIIDENTQIYIEKYADFSYCDSENQDNINLFIKGVLCGEMKVWLDVEEDEREYVTINHEIIYLDCLDKQNL